MKHFFIFCFLFLTLISCRNIQQKADMIITNAKIYTVDSSFTVCESMAIIDGKIAAYGNNVWVNETFISDSVLDMKGKTILPGIYDAHCHFYGYGKGLTEIDLVGTNSFEEVIQRTINYVKQNKLFPEAITPKKHGTNWIIGRGWDQNDWKNKEYPDRKKLDSLFPDVPVILTRVDGHAALVNNVALNIAKFTSATKIKGGELIIKQGKLSGVLVDNAVDSVKRLITSQSYDQIKNALLIAQENCLSTGITSVADAGLEKKIIDAIDSLHKTDELKIRVYAMLAPNKENLDYYLANGPYKTDKLTVCSFKFYVDGALGSRGACLLQNYSDKKNWKGFLLNDVSYFEEKAKLMAEKGFQMNSHCIGDSSLRVMLNIYEKYSGTNTRWRIEHAQIVSPLDLKKFKNVIPSVQPAHATSDMYWAAERLGEERIKTAYAFKNLLKESGTLALGTDFPVEDISPFKTFYAAVARKDAKGFPENGFQKENSLTREETLKGMTVWAAYAGFEENEKGSLTKNKYADFIVLDKDIMTCSENEILNTHVLYTFISGKQVYKK
jgi:predicted amidohydrolase YtcJ